jgi:hypothetical protein
MLEDYSELPLKSLYQIAEDNFLRLREAYNIDKYLKSLIDKKENEMMMDLFVKEGLNKNYPPENFEGFKESETVLINDYLSNIHLSGSELAEKNGVNYNRLMTIITKYFKKLNIRK